MAVLCRDSLANPREMAAECAGVAAALAKSVALNRDAHVPRVAELLRLVAAAVQGRSKPPSFDEAPALVRAVSLLLGTTRMPDRVTLERARHLTGRLYDDSRALDGVETHEVSP